MKIACFGFVLFVAVVAFPQEQKSDTASDPQPSVTFPPDLERVLRDYESAWMKRDSQTLANLFTEDGLVLSPDSSIVRGRRAIAMHYSSAGGPLSLRAVAFSVDGTLGYIIGGFTDRPSHADRGKYTLTLRRDSSGKWLIMSDMDNGNIKQNDCHDLPKPPSSTDQER